MAGVKKSNFLAGVYTPPPPQKKKKKYGKKGEGEGGKQLGGGKGQEPRGSYGQGLGLPRYLRIPCFRGEWH